MKNKRFTSMRTGILVGFLGLFIVLGILIFTFMTDLYLVAFKNLETITVKENVREVEKEIEEKIKKLDTINQDWAIWDDSYLFAKGLDENFIERDLVEENFDRYDVNIILFVDETGKILYGKQKEFSIDRVKEVDKDVLQALFEMDIFANKKLEVEFQGIVVLNEKPMILSIRPILKTDGSGPVAGNIIFGRFIDVRMMKEISEKFEHKTSFELIGKMDVENKEAIRGKSIQIEPKNDAHIVGSIYLPEMLDQYWVKLNIAVPRDIMNIGKKFVHELSILATIIEAFILMMTLYILNKVVLSRITNLNKQVIRIKEDKLLSNRLKIDGKHDEITQLSIGINNMLEGMDLLQNEVIEAKDNLEIKVMERTNELIEMKNSLEMKVMERTNELQIINQRLEVEIVEREKIQDEMIFLAYHDNLTGLPNRILLTDRLNQGITLANRQEMLISVMFIDLDGFKVINDTLGHDQGDILLRQVAKRLTQSVRKNDTVCRIGGDEFVLFINGYEDEKNLDMIASKVMDCLKSPFVLRGQEYYVTISMGIAQHPVDGEDVETLMKNADIAMYEAKNLGKNQYKKCSKDLKDLAIETMSLTNSLHRAIDKNEMMLYYQPQVNGLTGEIEGVEALLRWNHPELGFISPKRFIPLAEKTRLILPIGNWVLRAACEQCKNWQMKGLKPIRMAVNFSIHQINKPDIVEEVKAILNEFSLQSSYLEIELTESIAMNHNGRVHETLQQFKDFGITLSIDDFGTEYSSLSRLKHLPIDRIKIDISFIQGLGLSEKDDAITKAVILLANNLGLKTIAEGVETKAQLDFLNARLCDEVQGFYMHKPMPANEMENLLRTLKQI